MPSSVKRSYWSHNVSSSSIEDVNFKKYSDEKFQQIFMHIITQSSKDNTYKFAFARFLLEYVENETKKEVPLKKIAKGFLKYYWPQICNSKLFQSAKDAQSTGKKGKPLIVKILRKEFPEPYYPQTFEKILNESKPDYFLTFNPVLHHQKLFLDVCKVKGIKVLNACRTGINDQTALVNDGETFDLDFNLTIDDYYQQIPKKTQKSNTHDVYDVAHEKWVKARNVSYLNKFSGLKNYLFDSDHDLIKSNFMYYGRNKFKVLKDALWIEYKRKSNYNFLNKNSISLPALDIPFVYFPMNIVEESSLLHYAPYYTDQIEVIRHIAKSIPIDCMLYVKEHAAAGVRRWNEISYYKEIMDMPNVKLIHPKVDNEILIKNSKLLISIRGTSTLKAVKFGIPAITFGKQPYQIIPSVFIVNSLSSLPALIKKALKFKTNPLDHQKFKEYFDIFGYSFDIQGFELKRNESFFSGNGVYSNVEILEKDVKNFLDVNKDMFSDVVQAHLKLIS